MEQRMPMFRRTKRIQHNKIRRTIIIKQQIKLGKTPGFFNAKETPGNGKEKVPGQTIKR